MALRSALNCCPGNQGKGCWHPMKARHGSGYARACVCVSLVTRGHEQNPAAFGRRRRRGGTDGGTEGRRAGSETAPDAVSLFLVSHMQQKHHPPPSSSSSSSSPYVDLIHTEALLSKFLKFCIPCISYKTPQMTATSNKCSFVLFRWLPSNATSGRDRRRWNG